MLGICYGMQLLAHQLGGHVAPASGRREYGPATLSVVIDPADDSQLFQIFQGIGASGAYSMSILTVYEMVPRAKLAVYGSLISIAIALATLTGPLLGGVINNNSTWRWIFYLKYVGISWIILPMLQTPPQPPSVLRSTFSRLTSIEILQVRDSRFCP